MRTYSGGKTEALSHEARMTEDQMNLLLSFSTVPTMVPERRMVRLYLACGVQISGNVRATK